MRPISGSAAGGATSDLAIAAGGQTLDFYLSPKRNVAAARRFLAKTLRSNTTAGSPRVINTDKAPSLARAIAELKSEGICPQTVEHRQVKYLNNVIEGDHGRLKRILGPKGRSKTGPRRTEHGCGDRQPGLRDGLRTLSRRDHGEMKLGRSWPLHPTLQQHLRRCRGA